MPTTRAEAVAPPAVADRRPLILCVDDDPVMLEVIEAYLSGEDWEVVKANDGREAIEAAGRRMPDLVLLDVTMPDMDGYSVCTELTTRRDASFTPVIFLTALGGEREKMKAFAAGAADYLTKPVDATALLKKVKTHLATRRAWRSLEEATAPAGPVAWDARLRPAAFAEFKDALIRRYQFAGERALSFSRILSTDLYERAPEFGFHAGDLARAIAEFTGLPYLERVDDGAVRLGTLPTAFCRSHWIVATQRDDRDVFVVTNPFNWELLEALRRISTADAPPRLEITTPAALAPLLAGRATKPATTTVVRPRPGAPSLRETVAMPVMTVPKAEVEALPDESSPIVKLVHDLIEKAHAMGASDIHIEPGEEDLVVRYRVDGDMHIARRLRPPDAVRPIVARLKIMSGLDIAEHRLPQDGRIVFRKFVPQAADFDLRVAIAPMQHGEKAVLRILDKRKALMPLTDLGFSPHNLELYRRRLRAPYGMVLHVGPTGSGKSMSLYAALNEMKDPTLNIQTAEDPIEYTLPGISQLQVRPDIGLTYASALRSFLRQDPDVILVGEIRDLETARAAVEASLTGHIVFSTLHTNDAASTMMRFQEMGIEPYMISASIVMVCAQRLLRRLCPDCRRAYEADEAQKRVVGAPADAPLTLYRPTGCDRCSGIGYRGRIGVHEVFAPDDALRRLISDPRAGAPAIRRAAVERCGMATLWQDAMDKVRAGVCSLEDASANVRSDDVTTD